MEISRRSLLTQTLAALGMTTGAKAIAAVCGPTHAQQEGPYYPEKDRNRDNDLAHLRAGDGVADGTPILLKGQVLDIDCKPLPGAIVEIWQAAHSGRYNHSGDANVKLKLDPKFQYWGRTTAGKNGEYEFTSIIPGHYPLDPRFTGLEPTGPRQFRPPHIHVKVHARGFLSLTTQLYFDPKSFDDADLAKTVSNLNRWENVDPDLMVLFSEVGGIRTGSFDIVLSR